MSLPLSRFLYQNVLWKGLYYAGVFCLNILIARVFQAERSGSAYYLISIFALVHLLSSLSLEAALTYFGARRDMAYGKLLAVSLAWTMIAASLLYVLIYISKSQTNFLDTKFSTDSILFFVIGNLLSSYGTALFFSQNNFIVPHVVNLGITLFFILVLPFGGQSILQAITLSNYFDVYFFGFLIQGLLTIGAFFLLNKERTRMIMPGTVDLKKLLQFCITAWIGNIVFFLLYRIDYWFVEKYCSLNELGNYIQVSKLAQLFFLIPSMFAGAIFPLTASGNKHIVLGWLGVISRMFIFVYSIVCVVLLFTGHWLFPLLFGKSFTLMHPIFILFIPGILSLSTLYSITAYNGGNNGLTRNMLGSLFALIFVVVANILFVPIYGVLAAAAICSGGYIFYQCYLLYHLKKSEHITLSSFFIMQPGDVKKIHSFLRRDKKIKHGISE